MVTSIEGKLESNDLNDKQHCVGRYFTC